MKLGILLLLCGTLSGAQSLPDAPSYLAVGSFDSPHPLRTNKQTLRSWQFYVPQITALTVTALDAYINRNKTYGTNNRPMLTGVGLAVDAGVPALIGLGASYLGDRFLWRPLGNGIAGYIIFRHTRGIVTGRYP